MAKNNVLLVFCFGIEIGRLGLDENQLVSSFQYNPDFLKSNKFVNLFPPTGILKRVDQTQLFSQFNNDTFRGLPPMIADSLPDMFGNVIFKTWLESKNKELKQISVLEQLAYVADRGMGALEFRPSKKIPQTSTIDLTEIIAVLKEVLKNKQETSSQVLNQKALLNIFKMGTSAGGARPKILISENRLTGEIIPGDLNHSIEFNHYLVKLSLEEDLTYSREVIEFCYYQTAIQLGIRMMPSKLIDNKHFATLRFDRQDGKKQHVLTACGLTGWDFTSPKESSYENLFELAVFLKVPQIELAELFRRMIFNILFCNTDDHLKNHSFIYNEVKDTWNLAPAYDLTYSLNPMFTYKRVSRALSVNGKRVEISLSDVLKIAEMYTIKNAKKVISEIEKGKQIWLENAHALNLPETIIQRIKADFTVLKD